MVESRLADANDICIFNRPTGQTHFFASLSPGLSLSLAGLLSPSQCYTVSRDLILDRVLCTLTMVFFLCFF